MATRSTIHWQCQSPSHLSLHSRHGNGGLTIHERAWAYCDGAGADDAHDWRETGGVALEMLVRWTAPNGVSRTDDRPYAGAGSSNGHLKAVKKTAGAHRA